MIVLLKKLTEWKDYDIDSNCSLKVYKRMFLYSISLHVVVVVVWALL